MQNQVLAFQLDGRKLGLPLTTVEKVLPAVEVTPLTGAPGYILGLVDVHGRLTPVLDLRQVLGLESRPMRPTDHMILARLANWQTILPVDSVVGVMRYDTDQLTPAASVVPGMPPAQGLLRHPEGIVMIYDVQQLLPVESAALDLLIQTAASAAIG